MESELEEFVVELEVSYGFQKQTTLKANVVRSG